MKKVIYGIALAALALAGSVSISAAPPGRTASATAPAGPAANMAGDASGISVTLPDLKHPGKLLGTLRAKTGSIRPLSTGWAADIQGVAAVLYQKGVRTAKLFAPRVRGNNLYNVISASGRVTIVSLAQKGTVLKADTVTWYPARNAILASGHVLYQDGRTGGTIRAPHIYADTALKSITTVRPAWLKGSQR